MQGNPNGSRLPVLREHPLSHPEIVPVLDADPELGERLPAPEFETARRSLLARVHVVELGPWDAATEWAGSDHPLGLLVLEGLVVRQTAVADRPSTELLGAGDILRPWDPDEEIGAIPMPACWHVAARLRVAVIDHRFMVAAARWPEVLDALGARMVRRARWLNFQLGLKQIVRVEGRVLLLLWALSDRWGVVTPRGVHVRLKLTHEALGRLIGARRPSVTTAIGMLTQAGELERVADGYMLFGDPEDALRRAAGDDERAQAA